MISMDTLPLVIPRKIVSNVVFELREADSSLMHSSLETLLACSSSWQLSQAVSYDKTIYQCS